MRKNLAICLIIICTTLLTVIVSAENFYQQRMEIREATFIEKISHFFGGGFNIYIGSQGAPSDLYVSVGETVTVKFVMSDFGAPADVSSYKVHTPAGNYDLTSNLKSLHDISVTYSFTPSTAGEFTVWESLILYSKGTNPFIYNQVNVHVTSQAKTCSEKNGQICPSRYNCYGTIVTASDTSQCCVPDVNTGQKCVMVINPECDSGTTKCIGQNYYECVSEFWKDKGLIIGQCGVTDGGSAGNCDQYGKSVGDVLYWCVDTQTVGITTCSNPPPARHTSYYCPNYGTKTENGIEICKNNLCNVQSSITKTCTDTDGKNYQTKGSVTWVIGTSSNVFEDRCTTSGLIEYYCDGNTEKEEVVVCTCSDGKCTSSAICEETSKACTTSDGCAGTQYCSNGVWGSCSKTDTSCGTQNTCSQSGGECKLFPLSNCDLNYDYLGDLGCGIGYDCCKSKSINQTPLADVKTITWTEFYSISNEDFATTNYRCKTNSDCIAREGYNVTCKDEKIMADRTFKSYKEGCDKNLKWMDDTIEILYWICPICPGSFSVCGTITQGKTAWDNYFSGSKYCVAESNTWYGKIWEGTLKLVGSLGLPAQYVMLITIGIIILLFMFIINFMKK